MSENARNEHPDAAVEFLLRIAAISPGDPGVTQFEKAYSKKLTTIRVWILGTGNIDKIPALERLILRITNPTMGEMLRSWGLPMTDNWEYNLSDEDKLLLACDLEGSYADIRHTLLIYKEEGPATEDIVYDRARAIRLCDDHLAALDRFAAKIGMEPELYQ